MATGNFKELKNNSLNRIAKKFKYKGDLNDLHNKIVKSRKTEEGNPHYWIRTTGDRIYSSKDNILKLTNKNKDGKEVINYGLISNLCKYGVDEKYALDVEGVGKIYPRHMYPDVCTPTLVNKEPLTRLKKQLGFNGSLDELDIKIQEGLKVNNTDGKKHYFYWGTGDDLYNVDENLAKRDLTDPKVVEFVKGLCNPNISDQYLIDVEIDNEIKKLRPRDLYPVFCEDLYPANLFTEQQQNETTSASQQTNGATSASQQQNGTTSASQQKNGTTSASQQKNGTKSDSSGSDENKKLSTGIIIAVVAAVIIVSITVYLYMNPNALEKIKKWLSKNIQL
jgi:hypothetical protein